MPRTDLWNEIRDAMLSVGRPENADVVAVPISDGNFWVGVDSDAHCVLLVPPEPESRRLRLAGLSFDPEITLMVSMQAGPDFQRAFGVVRFGDIDIDGVNAASAVMASVVNGVHGGTGDSRAYRAVRSLADIFSSASPVAPKAEVGLWAELLTILATDSPGRLCSAWVGSWRSPIDFYSGSEGLEVKATRSFPRVHNFSLSQAAAASEGQVTVASYYLIEDPSGPSVDDLLGMVLAKIQGDLELQARVAILVAGVKPEGGWSLRFDEERARRSLWLVPFALIPKVVPEASVLEAHWSAQISDPAPAFGNTDLSSLATSLL